MKQTIKDAKSDPMGAAIRDYHKMGTAVRLRVLSSMFDEDEIPVHTLFRTFAEMPSIEQTALRMCGGRTLDVGAGAGCHSLALQEMHKDVVALDISPLSIEVMRERGVEQTEQRDFFSADLCGPYDTILMLMNGSGIIGTLSAMPQFFAQIDRLLTPNGCVLMDSCDLRYIFEDEEGKFDPSEFDHYYGEVDFQMRYKGVRGATFDWLYLDFATLADQAQKYGFVASIVEMGECCAYLAKIMRKA